MRFRSVPAEWLRWFAMAMLAAAAGVHAAEGPDAAADNPLADNAADRDAGQAAVAQDRPIDVDDLAAFVDGFVVGRMKSEQVVGVTVSVVHDGAMVFARGYGYDDLLERRPVQPERSLFRPGSISKTFTWTAIMQLHEQGKLDLDADIQSYLPNLQIARTFPEPITLAHLMAHTPGFEDSAMGHLFGGDPDAVPSLREYLQAHQPARVRPPGTLPAYSNYGTAVAGLIVENLSGMPWEDYVEQHLFEPLGMRDSTFREPWSDERGAPMPSHLRDNVSRGYARAAGSYRAGGFTFIGQVGPAGAMSTTATDMAQWMLAHLGDGRLGDAVILQPETARLMHRQHVTQDVQIPGMAHGFIESRIHGYRAIGHGGGTIHFLSDMQMVPELGLGVFISTNTAGGGFLLTREFVTALVARFFPEGPESVRERPVVGSARPLGAYAGTYLSTRRPYTTVERLFMTSGVRVAALDGSLLTTSPAGETRLYPIGGDAFRSEDTGDLVKFTTDGNGVVTAMLVPFPIMVMEKVGLLASPLTLYAILAFSAFVMACAIVGAWLRRKRPLPQTPAEAWAARTVIIAALVWLVVYGVAAASLAPILRDMSEAFFSFPSPLFVTALALALAAAVLTVLAALMLYPVWSDGSWPLWRRLRHTGVVLAAIATLLVLRDFNAIGFNYF
jgi:CubicO group peptidase (beta-lactamase class C family)